MPRKMRYIKSLEEARALAYFLSKEVLRHENDINRAREDLRELEEVWGVEQPEVDVEEWVEVGERRG